MELGGTVLRDIDKLFAAHERNLAALNETAVAQARHLAAHDQLNVIQGKRIEKLVDRVNRAYTKINDLERKVRALEGPVV